MNLTPKEKTFLKGFIENDFASDRTPAGNIESRFVVWYWAVEEWSGLEPHVAAGVAASLIEKGLIVTDGAQYGDENSVRLTDLGIEKIQSVFPDYFEGWAS